MRPTAATPAGSGPGSPSSTATRTRSASSAPRPPGARSRSPSSSTYAEHGTMPTGGGRVFRYALRGGLLEGAAGGVAGIVAEVGPRLSLDRTWGPVKGEGDDRPYEGF